MDDICRRRANAWANNEHFEPAERAEVQALLEAGDQAQIEERFYRHLEFGTGGMRAIVGQGTNRLNRHNIRRISRAVAETVKGLCPAPHRVAIAYDSRNTSEGFAREAAASFAGCGLEVLMFTRPAAVALISFAIRQADCRAGVMITASHNPPEYNGYKVFWSDGSQVTAPVDEAIIECFEALEDWPGGGGIPFEEGLGRGQIRWVAPEIEDAYFGAIHKAAINAELCRQRGRELSLVYTALHGTGTRPCLRALRELGPFDLIEVSAQAAPDGDFPTVASPNPEDPKALEMAVSLMRQKGADLALGTDPDTDRVGLALLHQGEVFYPNGHQLGALLLHYIASELSRQKRLPTRPYMVKTLVTTPLQERIAVGFGVEVENTLTGFKWICGRMNAIERRSPERNFIFATEESFGYLHHPFVRDKDGIASVALLAEMALWYKTRGMTLIDGIDEIHRRFGQSFEHLLCLDYQGRAGAKKIGRIMEHFRHSASPGASLAGAMVQKVEDLLSAGGEHPKSNVLGLHFHGGERLYLRPSGTEPKIKFYIMVQRPGRIEDFCAFIEAEAAAI